MTVHTATCGVSRDAQRRDPYWLPLWATGGMLSVPGRVTRDGEPYFPGHREPPARVVIDGAPGIGHLPVMNSGRNERYGLGRR